MRKAVFALLAVMMAALMLAGCGGTEKQASDSKAKHLTVGVYWFGETMDPGRGEDGWMVIRTGAGENLVTVTEKMEFAPQLAEKWENVNPTTWKFQIRKGVKFHNGDDMTPELVKASIERTIKQLEGSRAAADIKEIRVEGQDLVIETNQPNASLVAVMSAPEFIIVDTKDLSNVETTPILTGPYQVTGFVKGESIELKRNENYWGGKAGLDTLTVKNIEDNTKRAMALQSGELDMIQRVDAASRSLFENDSFKIYQTIGTRVFMLSANFDRILMDANLRHALAASTDYEALAQIEGNGAAPAGEIFPPTVPYGHVKSKRVLDTAAAQKFFAAAGYTTKNADGIYEKDGRPLVLKMAVWGTKTAMYEAIQAQLKAAGVNVEIVKVKNAATARETGDFDLVEENWVTVPTNDPYNFVSKVFRTEGASNRSHYSNPEVDAKIAQLQMTFDPKLRDEQIEAISELVVADDSRLFLAFPANTIVAKSNVKNVPVFPIDYYVITKDITVE
ncbi:ABC transporter substrate-binding protein [Selenomonas sp. TAMA-11512]|uniref:ABC transporter substrate-binding protein n=1 Tax=Selenomonas sp. TAMA-11512 TaxID=3095337 RepID=UPI003087373F|nr:ABC transporter substrate-binding protein [Selenomonas sp. TAMA-11512]